MYGNTPTHGNDRGQLLLIGALVTAISLVLLVTILNTALFSLNLSAQSPAPEADNPSEYRYVVHKEYGRTLLTLNNNSTETNVMSNVEQNMTLLNNLLLRRIGEDKSTIVNAEVTNVQDGVWVRQEETREFTNETNAYADWRVVTTDEARRVRITVQKSNLPTASTSSYVTGSDTTDVAEENLFHFEFNETGENHTWDVFLYRNSGDVVAILDEDGGDDSFKIVREDAEEVTFGLTTGQVNDRPGVFEYQAENLGRYDVYIKNPDPAVGDPPQGKYILVGREPGTSPAVTNLYSDRSQGNPYTKEVVYSVELEVDYHTPQLSYTDTMQVKPCATRADACTKRANPGIGSSTSSGGSGSGGSDTPDATIEGISDTSSCSNGNGKETPSFDVDWSATDGGDNLNTVDVTLKDSSGNVVASTSESVSGGSASGSTTLSGNKEKNQCGKDYTVTVTADDSDGNSDSTSETVTAG